MTATPGWTVREMAGGVDVLDARGEMVCLMNTGKIESDREAAGLIVRSVSALPALLAMLGESKGLFADGVLSMMTHDKPGRERGIAQARALRDRIDSLIALAKGGAS